MVIALEREKNISQSGPEFGPSFGALALNLSFSLAVNLALSSCDEPGLNLALAR